MELRLIVAYSLMLILALLAAALVTYRTYHSPGRVYRRRVDREKRDYDADRTPRL